MHNPLMMLIALALLFFLARAAWNVHKSADSVSVKLSQAQAEEEKLKAEQSDLSAQVYKLSTPSGLESELRTKYRAVKEGESVAVIVNDDQATSSSATNTSTTNGWWNKLLGLIGL